MGRKRYKFAGVAAGIAIGVAITGTEPSSAYAQAIDVSVVVEPPVIEGEPVIGDRSVPYTPVFVSREVVQAVPKMPEPDLGPEPTASDLRQLVSAMAVPAELDKQMRCLAGAVYFESRGEPLAGQLAVARVIINRADSRRFPDSYCDVVYQRKQFSFVRGGKMPRINKASAAWKKARKIAHIAHHESWESEAGDALYFHAHYVNPRWAKKKVARARINSHIFYRW